MAVRQLRKKGKETGCDGHVHCLNHSDNFIAVDRHMSTHVPLGTANKHSLFDASYTFKNYILRFIFNVAYVSLCRYVHMSTGALRG